MIEHKSAEGRYDEALGEQDVNVQFSDADVGRLIVDPATFTRPQVYHALFAFLRRESPVHWTEIEGHRPFWLIARYADIVEVERRSAQFINAPRAVLRPAAIENKLAELQEGHGEIIRSMNNMDGEEHRAFRSVTSRDFLRPNVEKMANDIDPIAEHFVQRLIDRAPECDFAADVVSWYPLRVIMTLMGVPPGDEPRMLELTHEIFAPPPPGLDDEAAYAVKAKAVDGFFDYFRPVIADRRANPRDDIASKIANARINGELISDFEAHSYMLTMATAGHDTTAATISGGLLALIQNPDQMAKLRANPNLLDTAIDEMLRWIAPVKHFFRTAVEDCEIGGQKIRAGDSIMIPFWGGCQDEDAFEDAASFRIDRTSNRHLALGSGPHACLGQHLAKLEVRKFYQKMLPRIDDIELNGEAVRAPSTFITGLTNLPIRYRVVA